MDGREDIYTIYLVLIYYKGGALWDHITGLMIIEIILNHLTISRGVVWVMHVSVRVLGIVITRRYRTTGSYLPHVIVHMKES